MSDEGVQRRRNMILTVLVIGSLLALVVSMQDRPSSAKGPGPYELTRSEKREMKKAVRDVLIDPDSAKFGSHFAKRNRSGDIEICGFVNARNSFGGMIGSQPYSLTLYKSGYVGVPRISNPKAIALWCGRAGLFSSDMVAFLTR